MKLIAKTYVSDKLQLEEEEFAPPPSSSALLQLTSWPTNTVAGPGHPTKGSDLASSVCHSLTDATHMTYINLCFVYGQPFGKRAVGAA